MYLLEFNEISKEVIWGGNSLSTVYSKPFDKDKTIGESWEICDLPNDNNVVSNGELKGKTLSYLVKEYGSKLLGTKYKEDYSSYVTFKILNNCGKFDSLTLANWKSLTQIIIGSNCCTKCKTFCISFCPKLRSLLIGESSFSSTQLDIQGNHWHEYYIIDCASLEEITIDRYSFNNSRYLSLKSVWNYAAS